MINQLHYAIVQAANWQQGNPTAQWLSPYQGQAAAGKNHFVTFLKPEATAVQAGVKTDAVLEIVFEIFKANNIEVGGARVLTSKYLEQHGVMDRHYGVINAISRSGVDAISEGAKKTLNEKFGKELSEGAEVLGGHQFIERFPQFTPFALSTMSDNMSVNKLAGGTYAISVKISGKTYLLLNAFHPFQLEYFTAPSKVIVVLECFSNTAWATLRDNVTGVTDPTAAVAGSIRRTLLDRKGELNIADVNRANNGVHLSAGPLEGMAEIVRFFSDHDKGGQMGYDQTTFGKLLAEKGASAYKIDELASNINLNVDGKTVSAFDLTENVDAEPAADKLLAAQPA